MVGRLSGFVAAACLATAATAQDESPLPPVGSLLGGVSVFACAVADRSETVVTLYTFRRVADRSVVLLTDGGGLPAVEHDGQFVVFDPDRMASFHISDERSGALVGGNHHPMTCSDITYTLRQTLRRLAQ